MMVAVAVFTATAAFASKLHLPGVLNSRRTKHSPQGQRLRRRCGHGDRGNGGGGGDGRRSRRWLLSGM